jgi:hypothetical protein
MLGISQVTGLISIPSNRYHPLSSNGVVSNG